jgi:hypothetical protein
METPGLGPLVKDEEFDWYVSLSRPVAALGGATVRLTLHGFDEDPDKAGYVAVIDEFLSLEQSVLTPATAAVFSYYQDTVASVAADADWDWYVDIPSPEQVWDHITLGGEAEVQRHHRDGHVYLSIECECDWEPEHGLQIVIRHGRVVSKVGPYDGHLTNASAVGRDDPTDVIYRRINRASG